MNSLYDEAKRYFGYTQSIRRDLHRHPELGFEEIRTARIIADELQKLGLEVTTGVAKTGVVGVIEGAGPGPTVLARFDMDALPVQEETGADYCSLDAGKMHACGHDGHVAIGLTVARLLAAQAPAFAGNVRLVFQPAEEGLGGAEQMVTAGILEQVDYALALHLWNDRPVGWVGIRSGPVMAAADIFNVKVIGRGGHGAIPQQTIDPVVATAHIITGIQTIVARNLSPFDAGVISATFLRAGEALNVIPPYAEFGGTIRTFDPSVRERLLDRLENLIRAMAEAYGCQAEISVEAWTKAVTNDAAVSQRVKQVFFETFTDYQLNETYQTTASEDMSEILSRIPGCYFFVGSADPQNGLDYPHHHPKFDFDENVLPVGAALMAGAVLKLLAE